MHDSTAPDLHADCHSYVEISSTYNVIVWCDKLGLWDKCSPLVAS